MKHLLMRLIVLVALFVNIAHDTIISVGDRHVSEHISEYVLEQTQTNDCGHMGEYHSLFHFSAIIIPQIPRIEKIEKTKPIISSAPLPVILVSETTIKPPIA